MARTSGGQGGAGSSELVAFPFAYDTPGLAGGVDVYVPAVGQVLLDLFVSVPAAWDGVSPTASVNRTGFSGLGGYTQDLTIADSSATYGLATTPGQPGWVSRDEANGFVSTDPLVLCVSQDGTYPTVQASVNADEAPPVIPLTIVATVNDTFVFTGAGGFGSPETFTMAPGVYATLNAITEAMAAATGSVSGEAFSTLCGLDDSPGYIQLTVEVDIGLAGNDDTITEGDGGAAALGFTGNPDTFAGGSGGATGSTMGTGVLYLQVATPA